MVEAAMSASRLQHLVSFDGHIGGDEDARKILETIPDENYVSPDESLDRDVISKVIAKSLSKLSRREENVMRLRFGLSSVEDEKNYEITNNEEILIMKGAL